MPTGLKVLYEDKDLGFQVLAHVNDKARKSPPHDHGASWAIYGQATKYTDMIEWERVGGDDKHAELKETKRYRLNPGQAGIYQDGKIHSIDYPDRARFIRVTGTNLDNIQRVRFDLDDRRSAPDDAAAGDLSAWPSAARRRRAGAARDAARRASELALIDVREERIFSESHLLFARSVPLSRLELRMARLVPRRATRIVLVDDGDGLAERAAQRARHGRLFRRAYPRRRQSPPGSAAGFELFSGVNVPSKAFGEFVEHESGTPSISAEELNALMQSGTDMVVLDSRPFDEYSRVSIPTGVNVPGAELVLRVHDMAPQPDTLVVVNCAGPHAQHHRRAVADQCGRAEQGRGAAQRHDGLEPRGAHARQRQVAARAGGVARRARLGEVRGRARRAQARHPQHRRGGARAPARRREAARSICSTCAIRPNTPPATWRARCRRRAGNWCRRPINMPARCARASSWSTTSEVRAVMTASWLRADGLARGVRAGRGGRGDGISGRPGARRRRRAGRRDRRRRRCPICCTRDDATVIDLSLSRDYHERAYSGRMVRDPRAARAGAPARSRRAAHVVLTSEDGVLAGLAVEEARALDGAAGALSRRRQRRVARRRISAHRRTIRAWPTSRSMPGSSPTSAPTA